MASAVSQGLDTAFTSPDVYHGPMTILKRVQHRLRFEPSKIRRCFGFAGYNGGYLSSIRNIFEGLSVELNVFGYKYLFCSSFAIDVSFHRLALRVFLSFRRKISGEVCHKFYIPSKSVSSSFDTKMFFINGANIFFFVRVASPRRTVYSLQRGNSYATMVVLQRLNCSIDNFNNFNDLTRKEYYFHRVNYFIVNEKSDTDQVRSKIDTISYTFHRTFCIYCINDWTYLMYKRLEVWKWKLSQTRIDLILNMSHSGSKKHWHA